MTNKPLYVVASIVLLFASLSTIAQTKQTGAGAAFGAMLSQGATGANEKPSEATVRSALTRMTNQLNKTMPVTVDNITRVDNMTASPTSAKLTYNATLDLSLQDIKSENLIDRMRPVLTKGVCTSPDMKFFMDNGVTVAYAYRAKDGAFAGKIEVSPKDCK